jgi:hypothetical protein
MNKFVGCAVLLLVASMPAFAADNLKLNSHLDYSSDSLDGPLITGDKLQSGLASGRPNYVFIYGEGCYNSKRQARRTVDLYSKYRDTVNFVIIDLDVPRSPEQEQLVKRFYRGYIPHVAVVARDGSALYDSSGEVDSQKIEGLLDKSLAAR